MLECTFSLCAVFQHPTNQWLVISIVTFTLLQLFIIVIIVYESTVYISKSDYRLLFYWL